MKSIYLSVDIKSDDSVTITHKKHLLYIIQKVSIFPESTINV